MLIENYLLRSFEEEPKEIYSISVPQGSVLIACKAIPSGIAVWYEIPALYTTIEKQYFKIVAKGESTPPRSTFIALIDVVFQVSETDQQIAIYPIYKLN